MTLTRVWCLVSAHPLIAGNVACLSISDGRGMVSAWVPGKCKLKDKRSLGLLQIVNSTAVARTVLFHKAVSERV